MSQIPSAPVVRNRSRGRINPGYTVYEVLSNAPSGNGVVATRVACGSSDWESMDDILIPNFHERVGNGETFFNAMTHVRLESSGHSNGSAVVSTSGSNIGVKYSCDGDWLSALLIDPVNRGVIRVRPGINGSLLPLISADPSVVERAIAVATTQSLSVQPDAQALVVMAEMGKTLRLFPELIRDWANCMSGINNRVQSLSGKYRYGREAGTLGRGEVARTNLRDFVAELADTWLPARFGVRPLVYDTVGLLKAWKREADPLKRRVTSRGNTVVEANSSSTGLLSYGITRTPCSETSNESCKLRAMSLWDLALTRNDYLGVNLANVPLAAVDLTRFSFVLNWVVNVNDFALALGSAIQPGWNRLGGCLVSENIRSTVYSVTGNTSSVNAGYAVTRNMAGAWVTTESILRRSPTRAVPTLTLRQNPFDFLKDWRLLDAAMLLRQQLKGRGIRTLSQLG